MKSMNVNDTKAPVCILSSPVLLLPASSLFEQRGCSHVISSSISARVIQEGTRTAGAGMKSLGFQQVKITISKVLTHLSNPKDVKSYFRRVPLFKRDSRKEHPNSFNPPKKRELRQKKRKQKEFSPKSSAYISCRRRSIVRCKLIFIVIGFRCRSFVSDRSYAGFEAIMLVLCYDCCCPVTPLCLLRRLTYLNTQRCLAPTVRPRVKERSG